MEPDAQGVLNAGGNLNSSHFERILDFKKEKLGLTKIASREILNKDSANIVPEDWGVIARAIYENYDEFDAFVVLHGTETMGYSTAALSFALPNIAKPVVFTGSQAAFGAAGSDSIVNLENAIRVIVTRPDIVGVYLVFGTQIVQGTRVKKKTEFDYDAFKSSRRFPPLGIVGSSIIFNEEQIKKHNACFKNCAKNKESLKLLDHFENNVVALSEHPGLSGDVITNLAKSGTRGFVLRSFGGGVPNVVRAGEDKKLALNDAFEYLMQNKIPIVITSQAPDAVACMSIYEPSIIAKKLGVIPGQDITIEAACVKLAHLLGAGYSYEKISKEFGKNLAGEISE